MATNVIIQQDPLAEFLNKIPELIFEAKAYGQELDWKTEQAELERAHEKEVKDIEFNRQFAGQLYQQNAALDQSIAELGIISAQAENLSDSEKTPGFDSFASIISGQYEGGKNELNEAISYLEQENESKLKTVASYNMGKNLFTQVDQNADGTIDASEKAAYAEEYGDLDIDFNSFSQGIYASEATAEQRAALDLSKEELTAAKLRNEYLPETLQVDLSIKNKTVDTMDKDLEIKAEELLAMEQAHALGKLEIDAAQIKLEQLEDETIINQATFNMEQTNYLKSALVEQQARDKINANALATTVLGKTLFYKGDSVTSMYDIVTQGDNKFMTKGTEHWSGEYNDIYQKYEEEYGISASIEADMLGLFNAIELGWDPATGALTTTEPFLAALDEIHSEVQDIKKSNSLIASGQYDELKKSFEKEYKAGAFDNPNEFIEYINDNYVDEDGNPELSEAELLDGDLLVTNRKLLDNVNKADTLLETITAQEYDEHDRLK